MRKCRKMISVIMLMVMLVSLLPSGALAAEAPTGATNEVAAVEEPTEVEPVTGETEETLPAKTKTDGTENEGDNETTITEGTSEGASVSDGTEETASGTEITEASTAGVTSAEVASEVEPTEASAAGETSVEVAPVVEPVDKEEKYAAPIDLTPYIPEGGIEILHKVNGTGPWVAYDKDKSPLKDKEPVRVNAIYKIPQGVITASSRVVEYQLPDGFKIDENHEEIPVKNTNGVVVGSMDVTTTGHVTITFNNAFATGYAINGSFSLDGTVDAGATPDGKITFPGSGGTYVIKIDQPITHDISCSKTNTDIIYDTATGSYKTSYTITASTVRGTADVVSFGDVITNPNESVYEYTYSNPTVWHIDAKGKTTQITKFELIDTGSWAPPNIRIMRLPALKAKEKYQLKYDVEIKMIKKEFTPSTHSQNSGVTITNKAHAVSVPDSSDVTKTLTIKPEMKKTGSLYDAGRLVYKFSVAVNPNKWNIANYTFKDTMSEGLKLSGTSISVTNSYTGKTVNIPISSLADKSSFSYKFTTSDWTAAELKQQFLITYYASALSAKDGATIKNNAEFGNGMVLYKDAQSFVVGKPTNETNKVTSGNVKQDNTNKTLTMSWALKSLQMPATMTAGSTVSYEDTLGKVVLCVDENGKPVTVSSETIADTVEVDGAQHYTTCSQINSAFDKALRVMNNDGYYIFVSDSNGARCVFHETGNADEAVDSNVFTFKLTGYDEDGNAIDICSNKDDTTTRIVKFKIDITANQDVDILNCTLSYGNHTYNTYVDYSGSSELYELINSGGLFRVINAIGTTVAGGAEDSAYHTWQVTHYLSKSSRATEINEEGRQDIIYYVTLDVGLINNNTETTFVDQRGYAEGYSGGYGTYVPGSATVTVYADMDDKGNGKGLMVSADKMKPYYTVDDSEDANGKLTFTFKPRDYNGCKYVYITYHVRIDEDEYWQDSTHNKKVYTNEFVDERGFKAESSTDVERETKILEKTGYQWYEAGSYQKFVGYDIKINTEEPVKDLNPESDEITLVDKLVDSSNIAEFQYNMLELRYYDKDAKDGKGAIVPNDEWSSDYNEKAKTLTVTLKDSTAYVLSYVYKINKDKIVDGKTKITNYAELEGYKSKTDNTLRDVTFDAHADQRTLNFVKVQSGKDNLKLPNATFVLEKYNGSNWSKVSEQTTGEEGNFRLDCETMETDVLYRLTETKAPEGYSNKDLFGNDFTYYFVLKSEDETDEAAKQKVYFGTDVFPTTSTYRFFDYNGGETKIENRQVSELTVSKTVENGSTSDNNKNFNFTVTLSDKTINGKYGDMTFVNGVAQFTLKHGESKTAKDLTTDITYKVEEETVDGYTVSKSGDTGTISTKKSEAKFVNTPDSASISVTKVWNDTNDKDGLRPESIQVQLKANGTAKGDAVTLNESNKWTYTWKNLPKNESGEAIEYTVDEVSVPAGYTKTVSADSTKTVYTITNSHTPEEISIPVEKVWNDNDNQDGIRPASIQVQLTADGKNSGSAVTLNAANQWKHTWTKLPKYSAGKEITYAVKEVSVPDGYTAVVTGSAAAGFTVTNSHGPVPISVSVEKVWSDADNQDGIRPDSIQVQLKANGTAKGDAVALNESNKWTYTWKNLPKNEGGKEIEYTVDEVAVPDGYTKTVAADESKTSYTITNSHTPEVLNIPVEKIWNDNNNQDGIRPASIQVQLTADGKNVGSPVTLNAANSWKYTWTNMPKKADGKVVTYKVVESNVPAGYQVSYSGNVTNGFKVTNTHKQDEISVSVEKIWSDADDQDGIRPGSIQVQLKADGVVKGEAVTLPTEDGSWSYTWEGLAKKAAGADIVYTVDEVSVPDGYKKTVAADNSKTSYTITNSHTPEETSVSVEKVWNDADNQDGKRPATIQVQLKADGENKGEAVTLNAANNWQHSWTGLAKKADGKTIEYTVDEVSVPDGYTKAVAADDNKTSYTITNSYTPGKVSVDVLKVWDDADNQDGVRPASIQVQLKADGANAGSAVTLNAANKWAYTWSGLDEMKDGKRIVYTVDETAVPSDYTKTGVKKTVSGNTTSFEITNKHVPAETEVSVKKVWEDKNNQDGKRPASVTVQLKANGENSGDAVTLNEGNNWAYKWEKLPKKAEGVDIVYTVDETEVPDEYSKTVSADSTKTVYTITNSYTPGKTSISVEKVWDDNNNQDGKRPASVTVQLKADGVNKGEPVTLKEGSWTYTWSDLDKMAAGKGITYTVDEVEVPEEYEKTVTANGDKTSYTITNKHVPETIDIDVEKVWEDLDNIDKIRPEDVTVKLLADKVDAGVEAVTLSEDNDWADGWTGLARYKDGKEIGYTVAEDAVDGYTTGYEFEENTDEDGKLSGYSFTVTNTHNGRPVSISKVDITSQEEVAGATLQVIDSTGKVVEEWTSTDDKKPHIVYGLTPGAKYTLRETVAPLGYTIAADTEFTVDAEGNVDSKGTVTENNILLVEDTKTKVNIRKTDIVSDKELPGATLQVIDSEGKVRDEWISTEEDHVIEGLLTGVEYTLRETVAPDGYTIISDTKFTIGTKNEVTSSGTTTTAKDGTPVLVVEDEMTKVNISKVEIGGEEELQGATLQILDSEGNVVVVKDRNGNDVTLKWVSGKEPRLIEGLLTGVEYTLRETIAPDGYMIATDIRFSIATDGTVTSTGKITDAGVMLIEDEPTKVKISKIEIANGEELPGATLQVLDVEGNVVEIKDNDGKVVEKLEWVSGEEPKYIEGLPTGIEYTLRETIAPDGYTIASDTKFTINEKGEVTSSGTTSMDEEGNIILVVEDDLTHITVSKVDTGAGKELPGAKIQIIDEDGKVVEEWTSTTEPHKIDGLKTGVKYILREKVAPLGYTLTSDTTFTIDEKGNVTSTGTVNQEGMLVIEDTITEVQILKVDAKSGKGLAGAKLQVLDDNGVVCDEWESTTEAHKITGLYTGVKYTLHEVSAPNGYKVAKDVTFTMDEYGKVSGSSVKDGVVIMKDEQNPPPKNKTGDEANGTLWALLLMMASGALGGTVWFKRKRRA